MDDDCMVTTFVVVAETMQVLGHRDDARAGASDAAVLPVAVVAAKYCQDHHARALPVMQRGHSLSGPLSASRFNRRLHRLRDWRGLLADARGEVFARGTAFLIDSRPVPAGKRARAGRGKKVRGRAFCGYCPAKREAFFGGRRHRVCTPAGVPVRFDLVPGGLHGLPPIHALAHGLPAGAAVYGDKGDNAAPDEATLLAASGVRLVPIRKANMRPNRWADKLALRAHRRRSETRYRQSEAMGLERLRARTNPGLERKVHASVLAAALTNAD